MLLPDLFLYLNWIYATFEMQIFAETALDIARQQTSEWAFPFKYFSFVKLYH